MVNPINNCDLMRIINYQLQKLKTNHAEPPPICCNISYGESLFQNFVLKNTTENLISIIRFCIEYEVSITKMLDHEKKAVNDISIAIAEDLFDLKFNFNLHNLLNLTKHLIENEMCTVASDESDNIINLKQASKILSMSIQTIRNRAKRGEIPTFGKSVKGYRFERSALLEWGRNYRNK